jgi:D-sedoheptulose 7-phosphate isomerase
MERKRLNEILEEHTFIARRLFERQGDRLEKACGVLIRALQGGGKLVLFGNGGASDVARHMGCKLMGRYEKERPAIPAVVLSNDAATITSIANDYGLENVFARQIEAMASKADACMVMSTSGHARNLVEGVRAARELGVPVVGLLGREGGRVGEMVDVPLVVEAQSSARIQEVQLLVTHVLCDAIERELYFRKS